jgi:DNA modification methylase
MKREIDKKNVICRRERKNHWSGTTKMGLGWDVFEGNALDILRTLPHEYFSCVITSPPYYWLRDYGVEGQIGHEPTIDGYVQTITSVMDQVHNLLTKDGILFLNLGDTYYSGKGKSCGIDPKSSARRFGLRAVDANGLGVPQKSTIGIPWRVALNMISQGWVLRSPIIWKKDKCLPEAVKDRPRRKYEYVFMFVKSKHYYFNRIPILSEEDVWAIPDHPNSISRGLHSAAFPDKLVKRCLDIGCPNKGIVLDPFAGVGTTLRVALKKGRSAVGIDLNHDFCKFMVNILKDV